MNRVPVCVGSQRRRRRQHGGRGPQTWSSTLTSLNGGGPVDVRLDGSFRQVGFAEQDLEIEVGLVLTTREGQLQDPREVDVTPAIILHSVRERPRRQQVLRGNRRRQRLLTDVSTRILWTPAWVKFCRPITISKMNRLKHVAVAGCGSNVVTKMTPVLIPPVRC